MTKKTKSLIVKKAWEIFRTLKGDRDAKLSQAFTLAWEEYRRCHNRRFGTPLIEGEEVVVEGEHYKTKYSGEKSFSHSCLVASYSKRIHELYVQYAKVYYKDVIRPGVTAVSMVVDHGFVDGEPVNVDLNSNCIDRVYGDTYCIKETLKKYGFKWDRAEGAWVR